MAGERNIFGTSIVLWDIFKTLMWSFSLEPTRRFLLLSKISHPSFASHVARAFEENDSKLVFLSSTGKSWVIDFEAIDQMTSNSSLITYSRSLLVKYVQIVNETPIPITLAKKALFSLTLSMFFVLLARTLFNNLLSS